MEDRPAGRRTRQVRPFHDEALRLHRKAGSSDRIIAHCEAVAEVTWVLCERLTEVGTILDSEAAYAGALLHDIGRTKTQTVRHGLEGATILAGEGLDETVVEIVRRHVGAGISAEEAKTLGFPEFDYVPSGIEEVVVCFADKMVDGERVRPFIEEVRRFEKKGHDVQRLQALRKRLEEELKADAEIVIFDKIKAPE